MFELSPDLIELQEWSREFARRSIAPRALDMDRAPKDEFCWELVREAGKAGLLNLFFPAAIGGGGLGPPPGLSTAIVTEEIAAACAGASCIFGAHSLGSLPVLGSMDFGKWERFLGPLVESAETDRPKLAAIALTEPDAGSDLEDREAMQGPVLKTRARRTPDGYIIDGRKIFISNGSVAHLVCVVASLDRQAGADAWVTLAVEAGTPGFSVGQVFDKMGQRACPAAELVFDGVEVPGENLLSDTGPAGSGWPRTRFGLAMTRGQVGAVAVGIARAAYEKALDYAAVRVQGGKPIVAHQAIQLLLADMATRIEAARLLAWKACWLAGTGRPSFEIASMAKVFGSDTAVSVATDAIQILGGYGYMHEYGVEKLLRDAKLTQIYEGANQINRTAIAAELTEREQR